MRIGNRMGGAVARAIVVAAALGPAARAVERPQPVPLGGALGGQSGDRGFAVYVPTRFGGVLTIKATSGQVEEIIGPDGRVRQNGQEVGQDQHGWYTFRVKGTDSGQVYSVETSFVQVGESLRKPWNFYYWPTKSDAIHEPWDGTGDGRANTRAFGDDEQVVPPGAFVTPGQDIVRAGPNGILESAPGQGDAVTWFPNLYDNLSFRGGDGQLYTTPAPFLKYDQLFSSGARNWESSQTQNHDIQRWPGHCLGGAIASIMLNEPTPAPGSGMTQDELKGLWAELGENHLNHQIGDNANNIPPGPPRPGWDECDRFVPRFHAMLESHIRGRRQALLANLRAFPPNGTAAEVWNHGVGKYIATYHSIPGRGDRAVRLEVELVANTGSNLNNSDNKPRIVKYQYALVYGTNGMVDEVNPGTSDWMSVGGEALFAPLNLMEVVKSNWSGHNPMITEANVRSIDLANGGFGGRFAGPPPTFRPVGSYEFGRGSLFAFGNRGAGSSPDVPSPRGRFFRLFGR
jgi:hypothetical protein